MYRIVVSNGSERDAFYIENERQANLLFYMGKKSNMFKHVELHMWLEGYSPIKRWNKNTEENDDG